MKKIIYIALAAAALFYAVVSARVCGGPCAERL